MIHKPFSSMVVGLLCSAIFFSINDPVTATQTAACKLAPKSDYQAPSAKADRTTAYARACQYPALENLINDLAWEIVKDHDQSLFGKTCTILASVYLRETYIPQAIMEFRLLSIDQKLAMKACEMASDPRAVKTLSQFVETPLANLIRTKAKSIEDDLIALVSGESIKYPAFKKGFPNCSITVQRVNQMVFKLILETPSMVFGRHWNKTIDNLRVQKAARYIAFLQWQANDFGSDNNGKNIREFFLDNSATHMDYLLNMVFSTKMNFHLHDKIYGVFNRLPNYQDFAQPRQHEVETRFLTESAP